MKAGQRFNSYNDFRDALDKYEEERKVKYKLKNTKKLQNCFINGKKRDLVAEGYKKELMYYQGTLQCSRAKKSSCEAKITFQTVDKNHLQLQTVNEQHNEECSAASSTEKAKTPKVLDNSEIDDIVNKIKNSLCASANEERRKKLDDCKSLLELWEDDRSSHKNIRDKLSSTPTIEEASSSGQGTTNISPSPQNSSGKPKAMSTPEIYTSVDCPIEILKFNKKFFKRLYLWPEPTKYYFLIWFTLMFMTLPAMLVDLFITLRKKQIKLSDFSEHLVELLSIFIGIYIYIVSNTIQKDILQIYKRLTQLQLYHKRDHRFLMEAESHTKLITQGFMCLAIIICHPLFTSIPLLTYKECKKDIDEIMQHNFTKYIELPVCGLELKGRYPFDVNYHFWLWLIIEITQVIGGIATTSIPASISDMMNDCFGKIFVVHFLVLGVGISLLTLAIAMGEKTEMMRLSMELNAWIFVLFIPNHYGQQFMSEESISEDVARAVYETNWYEAPVHIRKALLMIMIRSQRSLNFQTKSIGIFCYASFVGLSEKVMLINNKTLKILLFFALSQEIIGNKCIRRDYGETSFICVCNSNYCDSIEPLPKHLEPNQYVTYTSTKDELRMKQKIITKSSFQFRSKPDIILSRTKTYQKIMGFGGAWTDATGINIADLPKPAQDLLMQQYFGENGIQYTVLRIPIGGTDNSVRGYTLDDVPNDTELVHFNLSEEDFKYRIPYLKQAIELSENYPIHLMAASWSAPAYMKTNKQIRGMGFLKREYYQVYANYLVKFVQEYQRHGFNFSSMSAQNEPVMGGTPIVHFNGMTWNPLQQTDFIMNNLSPTLTQNGFDDVQIIVGDDQRYFIFFWMLEMLLYRPNVTKYFGGIGVHWYLDVYRPPSDLTIIHHMPGLEDKFIMYTEGCESGLVGLDPARPPRPGVALGDWRNGERYLSSIIETLNHWSQGWVDWNLVLDLNGGPIWVFNVVNAPIIVNKTSGEFYKNAMYYAMAHASKFLVPGSIRIDMVNNQDKIQATAFDTPDNRTVIVLNNLHAERFFLSVQDVERQWNKNLEILPNSFMTVIY
ncbi:uncharacterized protein LOC123294228 [Chrysoperla carnea]|uniref:uncharacterized protein LOC123294228 n=1 Tax=Chrysoperla carnea TaxID=189513 RepID=UPI001D06A5DF|nr:uncharacterized protein LOC123294228 [Chrysoperla carnea]